MVGLKKLNGAHFYSIWARWPWWAFLWLALAWVGSGCDDGSAQDPEQFKTGTVTVSLNLTNLPDPQAPYSVLMFRRTSTVPAELVGRTQWAEGNGEGAYSGPSLNDGIAQVTLQEVDEDWQPTGQAVAVGGGTFDLYITIDADGDAATRTSAGRVVAATGLREAIFRSAFDGDHVVALERDYSQLLGAVVPEITVGTGLESDDTTIYCAVLMAAGEFSSPTDPTILAFYSGLSGDATDGALRLTDPLLGQVLPGLARAYCFKDINGDGGLSAGDLEATITGRDLNESADFIFDAGVFESIQ